MTFTCDCCGEKTEGEPAYVDTELNVVRRYCLACYNNPCLWFNKPEQVAELKRYNKLHPVQAPLVRFQEA